MKMYSIHNAEEIRAEISKLHQKKQMEFGPIWEAWYTARKELNEIGYAMDKLIEAEKTGAVNSKTLKTIEKYFPRETKTCVRT